MGNPVRFSWVLAVSGSCFLFVLFSFKFIIDFTDGHSVNSFLLYYIPNSIAILYGLGAIAFWVHNKRTFGSFLFYLLPIYAVLSAFFGFLFYLVLGGLVNDSYFVFFFWGEVLVGLFFLNIWANNFLNYEIDSGDKIKFKIVALLVSAFSIFGYFMIVASYFGHHK